jgi:hypothetical protein
MFRYIFTLLRSFRHAVSSMIWLAFFYATVLSLNPYLIKTLINTITSEKSILWPSLSYLTLHGLLVLSFRVHSYFVEIKMIPSLRKKISEDAMDRLLSRSYRDMRSDLEGRYGHKVIDLMHSIPEGIQLVMDQFLGLLGGLRFFYASPSFPVPFLSSVPMHGQILAQNSRVTLWI